MLGGHKMQERVAGLTNLSDIRPRTCVGGDSGFADKKGDRIRFKAPTPRTAPPKRRAASRRSSANPVCPRHPSTCAPVMCGGKPK
eukprot:5560389-Prymnesium_polylepis.1